MDWALHHWIEALSLVLLATGVWWLMPRPMHRPRAVGILLTVIGAALLGARLEDGTGPLLETVLFWLFSAGAVISAVLMITNRNPVYSALCFALVTLSVCGLFLLQFAPFLAAATTVVYAGAIVVTFVFVNMLAQQAGSTVYDQRSRQPIVATFAAFVLLGMILAQLPRAGGNVTANAELADSNAAALETTSEVVTAGPETGDELVAANPLSQVPADQSIGQMRGLGRSLFGDYLFAVELAGTLLLVATIGAIAIARAPATGDAMTGEVERYLVVGALLFVLGALGFFTRRNLIVMMLSAEMMLHGVSLTLVTFSRMHHNLEGQAFTIFILTVATCEAGLALALILALYQKTNSLDVELWTELRESDVAPPTLVEDSLQPSYVPPEPMHFPQLTPAGIVPEVRNMRDARRVDDAGSPTAESPVDEPHVKDLMKTARKS